METAFYAFGTMNFIRIHSQLSDDTQRSILEEMQSLCNSLDDLLSAFKPSSEVSRINSAAGICPVPVSGAVFDMLKKAKYIAKVSGGAFDITIRPAITLWNIGSDTPRIPQAWELANVSRLVDYRDLQLDESTHTAFLKKSGQSIDLGGIAKGFAGDYIRNALISRGITNALLNFGGTILTIGGKPDGTDWKVGIQNPLLPRGTSVGMVSLRDSVLVTSGVNERFFLKGRTRYHHLLDPATCAPARSGVLSVTAAGNSAMDLDGYTTALFVLGAEKGIKLAQKEGLEVLYLTEDCKIISTKGFLSGKYKFSKSLTKNAV